MAHASAVRRCEEEAALNHGVIPRHLAVAAGISPGVIARLVRSGRWQRLYARAYVVSGCPISWRTHLSGISATLNGRFAFSHRTAAALFGLDGIPKGHLEVVTPRSTTIDGVGVHRIRGPLPRVIRAEGFPVTTCDRTVMDLFMVCPRAAAELALEDALRKRLTALDPLWDTYRALGRPGRTGCAAFRRALLTRDHRDGTLASRMETRLRRILKSVDGRTAIPQFPVGRYRLDFAYPEIKLGIEAQSIRWHMGEARFVYDLARDRALKSEDWTVLYYAWDDLLNPARVAAEVAAWREKLATRLF